MVDGQIRVADGRQVGYADYGARGDTPVLWCHGGPGSRLEPAAFEADARAQGLRLIGIDRPGYGKSSVQPGRKIADWVSDGLAVADSLGAERFVAVGVSTGGAYSLALAAASPRVIGVVACCALTDMRWPEGRRMMDKPGTGDIWAAASRETALGLATEIFGADGSKMLAPGGAIQELPPADLKLLADPQWLAGMVGGLREMFANGVQGYVDDRRADGPGWGSFEVSKVRCPVTVLHGGSDTIVPVAQARHTAEIVPGAKLDIRDELGHFSIAYEVLGAVTRLLR
ncbi:MAG TPA: alpha/beta hydrolase [Myxococcota bacterium]|nr:alpha/beta hydrolase [Myxococcota bacterium]